VSDSASGSVMLAFEFIFSVIIFSVMGSHVCGLSLSGRLRCHCGGVRVVVVGVIFVVDF
jgi:hypothetical protein